MADLTIKTLRQGLEEQERKSMTFKEFRLTRLVAVEDDLAVERPDSGKRGPEGEQAYTTAPTVTHLSAAVGIAASSIRTYEAGTASPRWEIGEMVAFAEALGLTVEELNCLIVNSARQGAAARLERVKAAKGKS